MLKDFVSLIYPDNCLGCDTPLMKGEQLVCLGCLMEIPESNFHLFSEAEDNPIKRKFYGKTEIKHGLAYFRYQKTTRVQKLLHRLKYKEAMELGSLLGKKYGIILREAGFSESFDIIIPVPLHPVKFKKRGFNQAELVASGIADGLGIPVRNDLLIRRIYTSTQTRKSRIERWKNVSSVFELVNPEEMNGKSILLVDDVITTGSTLDACAQQIRNVKTATVSVACLAVAE